MEILLSFVTLVGKVWGILEPFLFFWPIIGNWIQRKYTRVREQQFDVLFEGYLDEIAEYVASLEIMPPAAVRDLSAGLARETKYRIKRKDDLYIYKEGDVQRHLLKALLPDGDSKTNAFVEYRFFTEKGDTSRTDSTLTRSKFFLKLGFKKTIFHYLSIPNWRNKSYAQLQAGVRPITTVQPFLLDRFAIGIEDNVASRPAISKALDLVVCSGRISEDAIFKLSSSVKALLILKYGEGFREVYGVQNEELTQLKDQIKNLTENPGEKGKEEIKNLKAQAKTLRENWVRAPLNTIIEKHGFQKLFAHMDGVYVLPVTLVPQRFSQNPRAFIDEIIIPEAASYLKKVKKSAKFRPLVDSVPHYIVLSQVISVSDLEVRTSARKLSFASPAFSKLLFSSYLSLTPGGSRDLMINDVIRNVDFLSLISTETKTGRTIHDRFDDLQRILFADFSMDLHRPITLITLSNDNIESIARKFIGRKQSPRLQDLKKLLISKVAFYNELEEDFRKLRQGL